MDIVQQLQNEAKLLEARGLSVKFYPKSVVDEIESSNVGHKVYKTVDYIEIRWDNDQTIVDRPVIHSDDPDHIDHERSDIRRFAHIWTQYKAGKRDAEQVIGIPIENLFINDPGKADTYKHGAIRTVEQLADASDATLQRYMGGLADKALAQKYLARARDNYALEQQSVMINNVKEENDFLKQQMEAMRLEMSKLVDAKLKDAKAEPKTKKKTEEQTEP